MSIHPTLSAHPLAVISPQATLGRGVRVSAFCVIEHDVVIGDHCSIASHAVIKSGTRLGAHNTVGEGAVLGAFPQHTRMPEKLGRLEIGSHNTIREYCTLHRALHEHSSTVIGDHNFLMVGVHVAHDCRLGNSVICANNVLLAGHVLVGDRAFVSGAVAVHQFCRIGSLAMVGGHARVVQDVPPYMMVDGNTGCIVGLNLVGLRRNGFLSDEVIELKQAYRLIYRSGLKWTEVLESLKTRFTHGAAAELPKFLSEGTRGFVQERRLPPNATLKLRRDSDDEVRQAVQSKAG